MQIFGHDLSFWITALLATFVRVVSSERHSFWRSVVMVFVGVFTAWAFTDAALAYLHLDATTYKVPIAALLALSGEGIMRFLIGLGDNPLKILDIISRIKGGK